MSACVQLRGRLRSVFPGRRQAAALDGATGQVWQARFGGPHEVDPLLAWLGDLPGPVATVYESGPTGFGLYRALMAAGVTASVAASEVLDRFRSR